MEKWQLQSTRTVYDNFMKVEQRQYQMPDGTRKTFDIRLTRPTVCALAITEDNKVITVQQYRPGPDAILYELPGGYSNEGEDPEVAIARELREETGYEGELQFVTQCFEDAYSTIVRSCFVATDCRKVGEQHLDDSEFVKVVLLDLPDFLKEVRSGRMTDVEVALLGLDKLGLLS